jgi:hypothetical protein
VETRGGHTTACGPNWTRLKLKIPTVRLRTNSFVRKPARHGQRLLDFYLGARVFKLLLNGGGFFLANAVLYGLGRAVDQILGFL